MGGAGRFTYPHPMSESPETVDLHFNIAVAGKARRGQDVLGVERTPYVDGLLEHGVASLIAPETADETVLSPSTEPGGVAGQSESEPRTDDGDLTASGTATPDPPIGTSRRRAADAAARASSTQEAPEAAAGSGDAGDGHEAAAKAD